MTLEDWRPSMRNLKLVHRILEPFTVQSEVLDIGTHVVSNWVLLGGPNLKLLAILRTPLVYIRFKLTDVSPEGHHVIVSEGPFNCVVDVFSGNFTAILFWVPHLDRENSGVIYTTSNQCGPVLGLRTIEAQSDTVTLLQRP